MNSIILIVIAVFLLSITFSMFGMGGGLVYVPLFLFFYGNNSKVFILSFLCVLVSSLSSVIVYQKAKLIEWRLVAYLGIPLAIMMFLTGFLINHVSGDFIKIILGLTLTVAGLILIFPMKNIGFSSSVFRKLNKLVPEKKYKMAPIFLSPITFIVGFFAGVSGVAAGIFDTPIMVSILKLPPHSSVATSSAIVVMASFSGALGRMFSRNITGVFSYQLVIILLFVFLGAQIGPKISLNINKHLFRKICGVVITPTGLFYILKSFL